MELVVIFYLIFFLLFALGARAIERECSAWDKFEAERKIELEKRVAKLEQAKNS